VLRAELLASSTFSSKKDDRDDAAARDACVLQREVVEAADPPDRDEVGRLAPSTFTALNVVRPAT
jgi:hypothetical protein